MTEEKSRPRTDLYIALFVIAFLGFAAVSVGLSRERWRERTVPAAAQFSEQSALERLASSKLFRAGALATLVLSVLLLTVAGVAKLGGRSPVPQAPGNNVTWSIWAIVKSIVIFVFLYIVWLWITYFLGRGLPAGSPHPAVALSADSALKVLICIWIYIMLRTEYGADNSSMGIRLRGVGKALLYSFVGYLSIICVVIAAKAAWVLLGHHLGIEEKINPIVTLLLTEHSRQVVLITVFVVVVVAPLTEEFYFRVLIFCGLRRSFGFWASACISALFFALIHPDFYQIVPIFFLGIFLAYIYERTQNFASVVFVHALHNGIQVCLILSVRQV
jgi:membrane protease YdiL (CAAX protease family)